MDPGERVRSLGDLRVFGCTDRVLPGRPKIFAKKNFGLALYFGRKMLVWVALALEFV